MKTTGPGQSAVLLLEALRILKKNNIPYAVIGAMAASYYGVVRASMDADAVVPLLAPSLKELESHFRKARFRTTFRKGDWDDPIPALLELRDSFDNRVDLLGGIRGLDPDCFERTTTVPFQGTALQMIGLEDFIAMKVFAGSPKDLQDVSDAISVSGKKIKEALLKKVTARYGKQALQTLKKLRS